MNSRPTVYETAARGVEAPQTTGISAPDPAEGDASEQPAPFETSAAPFVATPGGASTNLRARSLARLAEELRDAMLVGDLGCAKTLHTIIGNLLSIEGDEGEPAPVVDISSARSKRGGGH